MLLIFSLTGCDNLPKGKPRILVIFVEGLSFGTFECESITAKEFPHARDSLCEKSSILTHFYANSTMVQSNVATLLSGLTQDKHKVINNGNNVLSKIINTLPEKSVQKGYRTAFFTDTPAVMKKSGLDQGIERFESVTEFTPEGLLRESFPLLLKEYRNWIDDNGGVPTLTFLYVSDLINPLLTSRLPVRSSENSNFDRLMKNFEDLFSLLSKKDNTTLYVVGVSGKPNIEGRKKLFNDNLFSENTHLAAMVYRPNTEPKNLDGLMSFVDLHSMIEADFSGIQFDYVEKPILQYGSWRAWFGVKEPLEGVRSKNIFVLKDLNVFEKTYDFYADKEEIQPVEQLIFSPSDSTKLEPFYQTTAFANKIFQIERTQKLSVQDFTKMLSDVKNNGFVMPWIFENLANKGAWAEITKFFNFFPYDVIATTHGQNGDKSPAVNFSVANPSGCSIYQNTSAKLDDFFRKCSDTDFYQTLKWVRGEENLFPEVRRSFSNYIYSRNLKKINSLFRFNWDISDTLSLELSNSDLFLWRKENSNFRKRLLKSISEKPILQD